VEYKIGIGVSNRHVHLTKDTYEKLFDVPLEKVKDLNQIGEFASNQFVTLKTLKGELVKTRIVGPFRKYNQVEISKSDAYFLGLNPPVRKSGDLAHSESITIVGKIGELTLENSCILSERHVHINTKDKDKYGVEDGEIVQVKIDGKRSAIIDAHVKITDNGYFEMHIDRDEANAFLLNNGDEGTLIL